MMENPDMMIAGRKIRQLRQARGLCVTELARQTGQPAWLIMLAENAHAPQSRELLDLLPRPVIDSLLDNVEAAFGVSRSRLTTADEPSLPDDQPHPAVMLLPVSLEPEDLVHIIDDLGMLAGEDHRADDLARQRIASLMQLYRLQLALQHKDAPGEKEHLRQLIQARIEALEPHEGGGNTPSPQQRKP